MYITYEYGLEQFTGWSSYRKKYKPWNMKLWERIIVTWQIFQNSIRKGAKTRKSVCMKNSIRRIYVVITCYKYTTHDILLQKYP